MKRRLRALALVLLAALAAVYAVPFPERYLGRARTVPARVFDRDGRLLRETLAADGTRGRRLPLREISPWLVRATLVAEDRHFYDHAGVDFLAALRAGGDGLAAGRTVSGASTITMQLVRLLKPMPRTWAAKLEQSLLALRLERRLGKDEILEEYLNRAPYGGNVVGVEAAAFRTFGKSARDVSPAEAALLAGLPQAPARFDPLRFLERARRRQRWILDEMRRLGHLDAEGHARATAEPLEVISRRAPSEGAGFVDWVLPAGEREVRTTLDGALQADLEGLLRRAEGHLGECGADEAAVVVLDNATGEVRGFAGPAARRRSPGSSLKPLVYALAIEGGRTAASIYDDVPVHFATPSGDYAPRNFDGRFYGPVTLRAALANSLNIPAMRALREVGPVRAVRFLREAGLEGLEDRPGLGLVIGNAEVSPVELAGAYSMLARGGVFIPPHGRPERREGKALLSPSTAWIISDILADDEARGLAFGRGTELAFPFRVAAKTGTSGDFRDNWVAGFTRDWTVVVWVGNGDGRPLRGTSGLAGAGPIFRSVVERLGEAWLERPPGMEEAEICDESGLRPGSGCSRRRFEWFASGKAPIEKCRPRPETFRMESPQEGDRFTVDPQAPGNARFLTFRAAAPPGSTVEWLLDGVPLGTTKEEHRLEWPVRIGRFELQARNGSDVSRRRFEVR